MGKPRVNQVTTHIYHHPNEPGDVLLKRPLGGRLSLNFYHRNHSVLWRNDHLV